MSGSLSLIFDLKVSAHGSNYLANSRDLVDRLKVKFAGEVMQDTDGYDLFKLCKHFLLTDYERASMFREGIQTVEFRRLDAILKIRRSQELTRRIDSTIFIRTNIGFHWIIRQTFKPETDSLFSSISGV